MRAIFVLGLLSACSTALGAVMPKWSAERHDADDGTFVSVTFDRPFDVGTTCDKPDYGTPGKERTTGSRVEIVPATEYIRAKVLCTVSDDPKLDRAFVLKVTRYVDGPGWNNGRAYGGMCDTLVEFDKVAKRKVGDKWELDVPIDMGDIVDIVFRDGYGTFAGQYKRYLDVDFVSRTQTRRDARSFENRMLVDSRFRSGVTVYGFSLEKSPVEFEPLPVRPGNVFAAGEKPETKVRLTVKRPGTYRLAWTVLDAAERPVGSGEEPFSSSCEKVVDLAQRDDGWYRLVYRLTDGARTLLTHRASFVLLPEDTRTEGVGEGPYGTWSYGGTHRTSGDIDFDGPLLERAGFRRAQGLRRYPAEKRHAYKLSPEAVRWPGGQLNETQKVALVRQQLKDDPGCRSMLVFHENATWGYQMAPEMSGVKRDPVKHGWFRGAKKPTDPALDAKVARGMHAAAMEQCRIMRENFPEVRLTLGNSLGCTELVAESIRYGLPEDYIDYMGLEAVVRNNLPERPWESSLLAGDLMLETAKAFGYGKWKVNACFESCYRLDSLIGEDLQAAYYVRDILMCQAWRFPDIFVGVLCDTGNDYTGSFWGGSGLCRRFPYAYPKKAYAAVAAATRLLDGVKSVRFLPTGDDCVYAAECARADGRCVTAFWTSRGEAELDVDTAWFKGVRHVDFYGRETPRPSPFVVGDFVRYIVSDGPAVKSVVVTARRFPDDAPPADVKIVAAADDLSGWRLAADKSPILEREPGSFMPFRTRGAFELRQADDDEMGDCLELELVCPNVALPPMMWEYAVVELAHPIPLAGDPASLGVWVKGNSGWGQVGFVLENAEGKRSISLGRNAHADVFDYQGAVSIDFTGWNFLRQLVDPLRSSVVDTTTNGEYVWDGADVTAGGNRLVGLAFAVQSRPQFIAERREKRQVLRFKNVSAFD